MKMLPIDGKELMLFSFRFLKQFPFGKNSINIREDHGRCSC